MNGLVMVTAMMNPTMQTATMMVETAVALVSLQATALNVNVMVDVLELELLTIQEMAIVMMKSTMQTAIMMVVTAVKLQIWFPMVTAMMKATLLSAITMKETVVALVS